MKEISLTKGKAALVDDWWFEELNQYKWYAHWNNHSQTMYAARRERGSGKMVYMHRVIANTPKGMECDHRNQNGLDNQERNLRNATRSQNSANTQVRSDSTTGEKCIRARYGGFNVYLTVGGKRVYNKTFRSLEEARQARDEALKKYHGEFAYLNFPNE